MDGTAAPAELLAGLSLAADKTVVRRFVVHVIEIVRVQDGRIVEHCNRVDRLGLLPQLGAPPVP